LFYIFLLLCRDCCASWLAKVEETNQELENILDSISEQTTVVHNLAEELNCLIDEHDDVTSDVQGARAELDELAKVEEKDRETIAALESRCASICELESEFSAAEGMLDNLRNLAADLKTKLSDVESQLTDNRAEISSLVHSISKRDSMISELTSVLESLKDELVDLERQVAAKEDEVASLLVDLAGLNL
jgi:chromosome segregation ATPase